MLRAGCSVPVRAPAASPPRQLAEIGPSVYVPAIRTLCTLADAVPGPALTDNPLAVNVPAELATLACDALGVPGSVATGCADTGSVPLATMPHAVDCAAGAAAAPLPVSTSAPAVIAPAPSTTPASTGIPKRR